MGFWSSKLKKLVRLELAHQLREKQESAEYRAWRDRFLNRRLKLCFWLAIPCLLTYTLNDFHNSDFGWSRWVEADFVRILFALVCGIIYQTKWGRHYPQWLMLWLSWSITMLPNIWTILRGVPAPSQVQLNMVFITQTALIPVYWRIHLLSQIGAVLSHWSGYFFGNSGELDLGLSLVYWFWTSFICTLAVWLYERLQRKEFEARRELDIFLHSISHDLRAPVTGTSMVLHNLIQKSDRHSNKVAVDRRILARLLQGSNRQLSMINSLLEAQTTAAHGILLQKQCCNLNRLVGEIVLDLEPILQQNGAIVHNRISPNLPKVNADPLQLRRIFNNLITNAFKHNPYGTNVTIKATQEYEIVRILVSDNGLGIPHGQQSKLFELYARGDRARYMPGLGMGLYLCRQIIAAHQGEIGLESNIERGATFWFTLPIDPDL